jgi:glycosyltransferase involved in cell wall biosynthesis
LTSKSTADITTHPRSALAPASTAIDGGRPTEHLPVSVVIPVYNRAEILRRCLTSVWSQLPATPAEVIVVDDASDDGTPDVAESMGATVLRQPQNRGPADARNRGMRAASHPWIALLDSDDEWLPHHLIHLWGLRNGHVLAAGSALNCGTDPAADRFHGPVTRRPVILDGGDRLIAPGNMIPISGSLIRRDLALEVGGFRSHRGHVEDFDMWLRLLERGTAVCSPDVSVIYHVHDDQRSLEDQSLMRLATHDAAEAHRRRIGGSRAPIRRLEGIAAWDYLRAALRTGDRRGAFRWGLRIAAHPQSVAGLMSALTWRHGLRRRSASLRAAGVRPSQRGNPERLAQDRPPAAEERSSLGS